MTFRALKRLNRYTLVVTEKPAAAQRIACALDDGGKASRNIVNGVACYQAQNSGKPLVVVPAMGHLYTVAASQKTQGQYPVFCYEWVPRNRAERGATRVGAYLRTISALAKEADEFVDACDYDIEGSIIGYCILKYACGGKEAHARRMKYSTLTEQELKQAYAMLLPHLDFNLVDAGLARHEIDWLFGINLSRALIQAAKSASGRYVTLSTGRVQGPTLKFLATRERGIARFNPTAFWKVRAKAKVGSAVFSVDHEKAVMDTQEEADAVLKKCKGKTGSVVSVDSMIRSQLPPPPFDLGTLQSEAYHRFGYAPVRTLAAAQRLYLNALISYPRTSSQKLPSAISYEEILRDLARNFEFKDLAETLLTKPLRPVEGKKTDPAHPAIYPTGKTTPNNLTAVERNVYGLITHRFIAAFAEPAVYEKVRAMLDFAGEKFYANGNRVLALGWLRFYEPYVGLRESPLPEISKGQLANLQNFTVREEHTKPPPRYNPASLLCKMEQGNIGTKATRAAIMQPLHDRGYIIGKQIAVTRLGMEVTDVLRKFCPTLVSVEFTRRLEEQMQQVQEGKETKQMLVSAAVEALKPVLESLKANELQVGKQLSRAIDEGKSKSTYFRDCRRGT